MKAHIGCQSSVNRFHFCSQGFHCKRCLEGSPDQSVLSKEVEIEPNVKLECVSKFCNLEDTRTFQNKWW